MFKENLDGKTHHDFDDCRKCVVCGGHEGHTSECKSIRMKLIILHTNKALDDYKTTFQDLADSDKK